MEERRTERLRRVARQLVEDALRQLEQPGPLDTGYTMAHLHNALEYIAEIQRIERVDDD